MELPLNERISALRVAAGYPNIADLQERLAQVNMPIPYSRLAYLERKAAMPTQYEFDAFEAAIGADPNCIIQGKCEGKAFKELQDHAIALSKKQTQHLINLSKANIPVIKKDL